MVTATEPDVERIWRAISDIQEEVAKSHLPTQATITIPGDKPIGIAHMYDMHVGSSGTNHKAIEKCGHLILKTPGMYCVAGEDIVDNFVHPKLLHAQQSSLAPVEVQWMLAKGILRWLAPKLVLIKAGNHEAWTEQVAGIDGLGAILEGQQAKYVGDGATVEYRVGNQVYRAAYAHDTRFHSMMNLSHGMKQALRGYGMTGWQDADLMIVGHLHVPDSETCLVGGKMRITMMAGSFKTHDSYATGKRLYGSRIGVPTAILWPNERRLLAIDDLPTACEVLTALRNS